MRRVLVVRMRCRVRDLRSVTMTVAQVNSPAMANCSIMPGAVCANASTPSSASVTALLVVSTMAMGGSSQASRVCSKPYLNGIRSPSNSSMMVAVRTAPSRRLASFSSSASMVVQADVLVSAMTISRAVLSARTALLYPLGMMTAAARSPSATIRSRSEALRESRFRAGGSGPSPPAGRGAYR